ncbi:MAG: hypothetical protein AAFQ04_05420 [Pseudomonadota bacterium]
MRYQRIIGRIVVARDLAALPLIFWAWDLVAGPGGQECLRIGPIKAARVRLHISEEFLKCIRAAGIVAEEHARIDIVQVNRDVNL